MQRVSSDSAYVDCDLSLEFIDVVADEREAGTESHSAQRFLSTTASLVREALREHDMPPGSEFGIHIGSVLCLKF